MNRNQIELQINNLLHERLFSAIRKMVVYKQKERYVNTKEFKESRDREQGLNKQYKQWYDSVSGYFFSYHSIYALHPLIQRELKIREFVSEEIYRVKADYIYNDIEFSAYYPTHYNSKMIKEIEDCIQEIKNAPAHVVDKYIQKKDTERLPHPPLTTAKLKYGAFYLFNIDPNYTTKLLNYLYVAGLITDPETNGWHIDDSVVEDIITVLHQIYPSNKILQYKRAYSDKAVDRTEKECIRPMYISSSYFPKNLIKNKEFNSIFFENEDDRNNAKRLYEFIFYITLSTQMSNSIYDTSTIEIIAKNKLLKEQANVLIEGEENWELLTGNIHKKLAQHEENNRRQIVVLPDIPQEAELKPIDVYAYSYNSKRPPRYGIGRFVTEILEKYNIGTNRHHDKIIDELISSKAIFQVKSMIHPQEASVIFIEWIQEYLPTFIDLEFLYELEEKINLASHGEINAQTILDDLNRLIDGAFQASGFSEDNTAPSESKIKLLKSLSIKHGFIIDESTLRSNAKIDIILAKYPIAEPIRVGSCPACNASVFQKEFLENSGRTIYYFSCEKFSKSENGCNFSIWDSYIHKFFSNKSMELFTIEERRESLKKILSKKKGYLFNGFIAKNKKPYDAKVFMEEYFDKDSNLKKWQMGLKFENKVQK